LEIDMSAPNYTVETVSDVLFRVVPNQQPARTVDRAVLFVHGFVGDPKETWQQKGAPDSFPSLLATDPDLADHDIYLFQYVTKSLHPPAIDNIADQLRYQIVNRLADKRIVFVAHSMGGLVAMRCILRLLDNSRSETISGLLVYGSPMNGVEWVKYAQLVLQLAKFKVPVLGFVSSFIKTNKQLAALTSGSEFVDQLNGRWILHVLNGGHPSVMTSQRAWFPVRVVTGNDDWVVKESSARGLYSQIDWIDVNEDHRTLVKPENRTASTYLIARDFLKDCRNWINPKSLLKLRSQLDTLWAMHVGKTISDWHFALNFEPPGPNDLQPAAFGVSGFRPFTVVECSYRRRIASDTLRFGFAVGPIAAGALWNDDFVFLHSIRFGALHPPVTQSLQAQLHTVLKGPDAWSRLFENVVIRIRHPDRKGDWHTLTPAATHLPDDGLVRDFTLPPEAAFLVNQEAVVDVAFRGLLPNVVNDYTMQFPWLCDGFVARVTVTGNPSYLITSQGMRAALRSQREQQGKVEYSSDDLILPESFLQFEWGY
jgi:pimeloyl-ACP methyl ester carboxylesterase